MNGPGAVAVLTGMRQVCLNLVTHFREVGPDPERALGHQQEVEAIDAVLALIEADKEYDAALAAIEDHHRDVARMGYADAAFSLTRSLAERLVNARIARDNAMLRVGGSA